MDGDERDILDGWIDYIRFCIFLVIPNTLSSSSSLQLAVFVINSILIYSNWTTK